MKRVLKRMSARASAFRPILGGKCIVLTYHRVLPEEMLNPAQSAWSMAVSKENFAAQMQLLTSHFDFLNEQEFLQWRRQPHAFKGTRAAVITFDDGWRDNIDFALPILSDLEIPASLYICTDHITSGQSFWWRLIEQLAQSQGTANLIVKLKRAFDEQGLCEHHHGQLTSELASAPIGTLIDRLKSIPAPSLVAAMSILARDETSDMREIMTWDEIKAMAASGVVIGPHTRSHAILPALSNEEMIAEIEGSANDLKNRDLLTSAFFCFPNGDYDAQSRAAVRAAGFNQSYGLGQRAVRASKASLDVVPRVNVGMHNAGDLDAFSWLLTRAGAFA